MDCRRLCLLSFHANQYFSLLHRSNVVFAIWQENKLFGTVLRISLSNSSPILGTTLYWTAFLVPATLYGHQRTLHALLARCQKVAKTADFEAVDPASLRPVAELMIPLWGEIYLNGSN